MMKDRKDDRDNVSSMFHSATNTERAQPAKEILMLLRQVDVCPLWETTSFTSVVNMTLQSCKKEQQ